MGTILASTIINKVNGALLNDASKVRFLSVDQLAFLNEAQRFIAGINPSSCSQIVVHTCAAGTRQVVPPTAHSFLGPLYNVDSADLSPQRVVDVVKRETLDVPDPNWRKKTQSAEIRHVIAYDELPTVFETYPPATAGAKLAIKVAVIPTDIGINEPIQLEDTYELAIINYILSRDWQKDTEYAGNTEKAAAYYSSVLQFLGMKAQVDPASSAESKTKGLSS